tara:strand:- start:466 stop:672 length:207 start_codon:yes stop_codon:yes gene_type:complete
MDKTKSNVQASFNEGAGLKKPAKDKRKFKESTKADPGAKHRNKPCPSGFYRNADGKCVQKGVGPQYKP